MYLTIVIPDNHKVQTRLADFVRAHPDVALECVSVDYAADSYNQGRWPIALFLGVGLLLPEA